jgi:hypothetical protein
LLVTAFLFFILFSITSYVSGLFSERQVAQRTSAAIFTHFFLPLVAFQNGSKVVKNQLNSTLQ